MTPTVSFVVPCYRLAHVLGECLRSILAQTFHDLEILVMDDRSPDDTPQVVRSVDDPRVIHVRNEQNLGHLANYNKGIGLARGRYVWLISPDDSLLAPYVLERFVELMEGAPRIGYVFCPVIPHVENRQVELAPFWYSDPKDAVFPGPIFLRMLLRGNCVPAPSAMVRRSCYERLGAFPLDLPFAGDWYLWCLFATAFDVGYLGEPMVRYRWHDTNMTHQLRRHDPRILLEDDLAVRWRIARHLTSSGLATEAEAWWSELAGCYVDQVAQREQDAESGLSLGEAQSSWDRRALGEGEQARIASRVYTALGDRAFHRRQVREATAFYREALRARPASAVAWLKYALARAGTPGAHVRKALTLARHARGRNSSLR
jgi:glycosyltransferase involved in cell wall biosynthesis